MTRQTQTDHIDITWGIDWTPALIDQAITQSSAIYVQPLEFDYILELDKNPKVDKCPICGWPGSYSSKIIGFIHGDCHILKDAIARCSDLPFTKEVALMVAVDSLQYCDQEKVKDLLAEQITDLGGWCDICGKPSYVGVKNVGIFHFDWIHDNCREIRAKIRMDLTRAAQKAKGVTNE